MNTFKIQNGDLVLGRGGLEQVDGADKIVQDVANWLTNDLGFNRFHPEMGASLDEFIPRGMTQATLHEIRQRVRESLKRYQKMQSDELIERVAIFGSREEGIGRARPTSIARDFGDPQVFRRADRVFVRVQFQTFTDEIQGVTLAVT